MCWDTESQLFFKLLLMLHQRQLTHLEESTIPVLHAWAYRLSSVALIDRSTAWKHGSLDSRWLLHCQDSNLQSPNDDCKPYSVVPLNKRCFTHLYISSRSYIFCHICDKLYSKFCKHRVRSLNKSAIFNVLTNCWSMLMSIRLNDRRWSFAPTKSRPFSSSSKNVW